MVPPSIRVSPRQSAPVCSAAPNATIATAAPAAATHLKLRTLHPHCDSTGYYAGFKFCVSVISTLFRVTLVPWAIVPEVSGSKVSRAAMVRVSPSF